MGTAKMWVMTRVTKPGSTSDAPIITCDLYPTLLEACGLKVPATHTVDGVSVVSVLKGDAAPERDALFWHYPHFLMFVTGPRQSAVDHPERHPFVSLGPLPLGQHVQQPFSFGVEVALAGVLAGHEQHSPGLVIDERPGPFAPSRDTIGSRRLTLHA